MTDNIVYVPISVSFMRQRQIEEVCEVKINVPNYYSQGLAERVALEHANAHGLWKEKKEMNVTGVSIIKGEITAQVCSRCGSSEHHVSDCDD